MDGEGVGIAVLALEGLVLCELLAVVVLLDHMFYGLLNIIIVFIIIQPLYPDSPIYQKVKVNTKRMICLC